MDKNKLTHAILIVIILLLSAYMGYQKFFVQPERDKKQLIERTLLQHSYDSSQNVINQLFQTILLDSLCIASLDTAAKQLAVKYIDEKNELAALKAQIGKKDPPILKYNVVEIENAFKNRYNDHAKADSIVTISKNIGQETLVDLDYYDILKKEIPIYDSIGILLNAKINNRDSVITIQGGTIKNYNKILLNYSNQRDILIKERNQSDDAAKKQKKKTIISQILGAAALILLILK